MVYLLSFYDKSTSEFVPVAVYDDKELAERRIKSEPGVRWNLVDMKINHFDYELFNMYN